MSEEGAKVTPIKPAKFYSNSSHIKKKISEIEEKCQKRRCLLKSVSDIRPSLLGPTRFWKEFHKQADALESAVQNSTKTDPLCTFVYQNYFTHGHRSFVVAHPEVYWHTFIKQVPDERCAYEVIPAGAPCWLYLDLEFQISLNPDNNGVAMTKTLIQVLCAFIKKYWKYECTETNVLNLDSTTDNKFSKHLIFCTKDVAFKHNLHIGRFIKGVVNEIDEYVSSNGSAYHDVLSYFSLRDLESLFVNTDKKRKMFVDTMVYSKNRHFRVYKATKFEKCSHLEVAAECNYEPTIQNKNHELAIFLDSLVSYFPDKSNLTLLEYNDDSSIDVKKFPLGVSQSSRFLTQDDKQGPNSPYPFIDKFIAKLVQPGYIRCCVHFKDSQTIIYEILGNRYCENIKRAHKSNNIYIVVDLKSKVFYQKCHDQEDCYGFKSKLRSLPIEITFLLDEDDEIFLSIPDFSDDSCSDNAPNSPS